MNFWATEFSCQNVVYLHFLDICLTVNNYLSIFCVKNVLNVVILNHIKFFMRFYSLKDAVINSESDNSFS